MLPLGCGVQCFSRRERREAGLTRSALAGLGLVMASEAADVPAAGATAGEGGGQGL